MLHRVTISNEMPENTRFKTDSGFFLPLPGYPLQALASEWILAPFSEPSCTLNALLCGMRGMNF